MRAQFYATDEQKEIIDKLFPADTEKRWLIVGQAFSMTPEVQFRFRYFAGLGAWLIHNAVRLASWLEGKYSDGYYERLGYEWYECADCTAPCEGRDEGGCWGEPIQWLEEA